MLSSEPDQSLCSTTQADFAFERPGFLYAGLLRRKSALTMLYLSFAGLAVVTFQWTIWGYSLAFSETGSEFIGDLRCVQASSVFSCSATDWSADGSQRLSKSHLPRHFALRDVLDAPSVGSPRIPAAVYMIYQLQFSAVTAVLTIGAFSERGRPGPIMAFVFVWSTLVYDPVARWVWAPKVRKPIVPVDSVRPLIISFSLTRAG